MGAIFFRALKPWCISYKPKTNSKTVQGERNGAGVRVEMGGQDGQGIQYGEGATGQATVTDESQADVILPWILEVGNLNSFWHAYRQLRYGVLPAAYVCEGSGNGGEGEEGQVTPALSGE